MAVRSKQDEEPTFVFSEMKFKRARLGVDFLQIPKIQEHTESIAEIK